MQVQPLLNMQEEMNALFFLSVKIYTNNNRLIVYLYKFISYSNRLIE
jgi:hypothetical protein